MFVDLKEINMKAQKSVYYMTDSELRAYKRMKRRARIIRNRIFAAILSVCFIALIAVCYFSIKSSANTWGNEISFKYYTEITVSDGESLWSIADEFIDYEQYKDKAAYVAEVKQINHLNDNCDIRSGQKLVLPYYSSEFMK